MRIIDLRNTDLASLQKSEIAFLLPRASQNNETVRNDVQKLLDDVRMHGDDALVEQTKKFDGVELKSIRVPESELISAWDNLNSELKSALLIAKERITKVHTDQLPKETVTRLDDDATVTNRFLPIESVGLYVPGGQAVYPSSVLMNAIPAIVAGVKNICIASPPQKANNGLPHSTILATCHLLGIKNCISVGGVGAIGAFTFGTKSIEKVDLITDPGNIFVATAKELVQGKVGIDSVAGPTEIMILADNTASTRFVAADLIGQAEHDELAGSVLVTDSEELANKVQEILPNLTNREMSRTRIIQALSGEQSAIILVKNIEDGIIIANEYGAEHLEIQTTNSAEIANKITNAGAIFIGDYSPVSLGDYIGGSNHVLPTGGTSRFSSGLGVHQFLRSVQEINYSKNALKKVQKHINVMANDEKLPAHANAVNIRFKEEI